MAIARWCVLAALLTSVPLLGGCRENEQNRRLEFEPHVYKGDKLPALTEQRVRELQQRGDLQR
jgi:hypothetical protein